MTYQIREIQKPDDPIVEAIIRACLVEFGGNHAGTAWADPDLCRFSEIYRGGGARYWVAADAAGQIVGGAGVGPLAGCAGVCELQKMYCRPEARGTGASHQLMDTALAYAGRHYRRCYLETFSNMLAAQRFYEKYGFARVGDPMGCTGHTACDVFYLRQLGPPEA